MPSTDPSNNFSNLLVGTKLGFVCFATRAFKSSSLCLLALLITVYSLLWNLCPWRELAELDMPSWIIDFAGRSMDFATTEPRKDVAIFGSSLILVVSKRLDSSSKLSSPQNLGGDENARFNIDLQNRISDSIGIPSRLVNAAVPGSLVSDQYCLLSEAIKHERAPSVLVLTLAPRDFIDNEIGSDLHGTPLRRVFFFMTSTRQGFPLSLRPVDIRQCMDSHLKFLALVQKWFRRSLVSWGCNVLNREENLWLSQQKSNRVRAQSSTSSLVSPNTKVTIGELGQMRESLSDATVLSQDLELYRRRYLPINQYLLGSQMKYLTDLLSQARSKGIRVVIFLMPLSPANRQLLPDGWLSRFGLDCQRIACDQGAEFFDMNGAPFSGMFNQSDFVDSVHVSRSGAEKFYQIFVERLLASSAIRLGLRNSKDTSR